MSSKLACVVSGCLQLQPREPATAAPVYLASVPPFDRFLWWDEAPNAGVGSGKGGVPCQSIPVGRREQSSRRDSLRAQRFTVTVHGPRVRCRHDATLSDIHSPRFLATRATTTTDSHVFPAFSARLIRKAATKTARESGRASRLASVRPADVTDPQANRRCTPRDVAFTFFLRKPWIFIRPKSSPQTTHHALTMPALHILQTQTQDNACLLSRSQSWASIHLPPSSSVWLLLAC
ncbi:hypothetical protein B0T24DRAFT_64158 [Lasiosphaeria ovina]|uniref:Uncharacterized protein n=1 Tax=Lasiosphaeria ovina TaxID=92902 RepID=A0AAE0TY80_9PEZI|nr:hypothetical protein B0T24DRAFT_64158 [Lasiosphaeria ovina]